MHATGLSESPQSDSETTATLLARGDTSSSSPNAPTYSSLPALTEKPEVSSSDTVSSPVVVAETLDLARKPLLESPPLESEASIHNDNKGQTTLHPNQIASDYNSTLLADTSRRSEITSRSLRPSPRQPSSARIHVQLWPEPVGTVASGCASVNDRHLSTTTSPDPATARCFRPSLAQGRLPASIGPPYADKVPNRSPILKPTAKAGTASSRLPAEASYISESAVSASPTLVRMRTQGASTDRHDLSDLASAQEDTADVSAHRPCRTTSKLPTRHSAASLPLYTQRMAKQLTVPDLEHPSNGTLDLQLPDRSHVPQVGEPKKQQDYGQTAPQSSGTSHLFPLELIRESDNHADSSRREFSSSADAKNGDGDDDDDENRSSSRSESGSPDRGASDFETSAVADADERSRAAAAKTENTDVDQTLPVDGKSDFARSSTYSATDAQPADREVSADVAPHPQPEVNMPSSSLHSRPHHGAAGRQLLGAYPHSSTSRVGARGSAAGRVQQLSQTHALRQPQSAPYQESQPGRGAAQSEDAFRQQRVAACLAMLSSPVSPDAPRPSIRSAARTYNLPKSTVHRLLQQARGASPAKRKRSKSIVPTGSGSVDRNASGPARHGVAPSAAQATTVVGALSTGRAGGQFASGGTVAVPRTDQGYHSSVQQHTPHSLNTGTSWESRKKAKVGPIAYGAGDHYYPGALDTPNVGYANTTPEVSQGMQYQDVTTPPPKKSSLDFILSGGCEKTKSPPSSNEYTKLGQEADATGRSLAPSPEQLPWPVSSSKSTREFSSAASSMHTTPALSSIDRLDQAQGRGISSIPPITSIARALFHDSARSTTSAITSPVLSPGDNRGARSALHTPQSTEQVRGAAGDASSARLVPPLSEITATFRSSSAGSARSGGAHGQDGVTGTTLTTTTTVTTATTGISSPAIPDSVTPCAATSPAPSRARGVGALPRSLYRAPIRSVLPSPLKPITSHPVAPLSELSKLGTGPSGVAGPNPSAEGAHAGAAGGAAGHADPRQDSTAPTPSGQRTDNDDREERGAAGGQEGSGNAQPSNVLDPAWTLVSLMRRAGPRCSA